MYTKILLINFLIAFFLLSASCREPRKQNMLGGDVRLYKDTPAWELAKAVDDEDLDKIRLILSSDSSLIGYREGVYDQTVFSQAVSNDRFKSIKLLLDLGADMNLIESYSKRTPFEDAALGNHSEALKIMLRYTQNTPQKDFVDALNLAVWGAWNGEETIDLFIKNGIQKKDTLGISIETAVSLDLYTVALKLLKSGVPFNDSVLFQLNRDFQITIKESILRCNNLPEWNEKNRRKFVEYLNKNYGTNIKLD